MAHEVETMAYIHDVHWYGLGRRMSKRSTLDVWLKEDGMDWPIREAEVMYQKPIAGQAFAFRSNPDAKVLYRSDTQAPLSVVQLRYKAVQPFEVLGLYRELVEARGLRNVFIDLLGLPHGGGGSFQQLGLNSVTCLFFSCVYVSHPGQRLTVTRSSGSICSRTKGD